MRSHRVTWDGRFYGKKPSQSRITEEFNMQGVAFLQLVPGFMSGVHQLHSALVGVTLVLAFAGLTVKLIQAQMQGCTRSIWPALVRLGVVSILVGSLELWGDTLAGAVNDLTAQMGTSGNVFEDYKQAIAQKWGSNGVAQQQQQFSAPTEGDTSEGFSVPSQIRLTHYGYPGDLTPDSNSSRGIGAFGYDSTPGSLIPGYSVALTASAATLLGVQPGQTFSYQGRTFRYDDIAPEGDPRMDIYDPNNTLTADGAPATAGGNQGFFASLGWLGHPVGSLATWFIGAVLFLLSLVALGCMWLMSVVQQILYLIEIAICPIFIGFLMVPALSGLAARFFTSLVAICLWPVAWAICNLVTKLLIDLAVNPSNNVGQGVLNGLSGVAPLAGAGYWVILAIWVIGSAIFAPWIVSKALVTYGVTAVSAVFGATVGSVAGSAYNVVTGLATRGMSVGAGGSAMVSPGSNSRLQPYKSYARRPIG
jgi:hypothetical protein